MEVQWLESRGWSKQSNGDVVTHVDQDGNSIPAMMAVDERVYYFMGISRIEGKRRIGEKWMRSEVKEDKMEE